MNSFLRRIKLNRLAPTFVVLSTLSAGILIGSVAVHGVKGSENQVNSSDATSLAIFVNCVPSCTGLGILSGVASELLT